MKAQEVEKIAKKLQRSCNLLIDKIGTIRIGKKTQFPYGWRKANKGRTVWRIVEEIIVQNLEKHHNLFELDLAIPSESEISVYDMTCMIDNIPLFINIKSAVDEQKQYRDDISKAEGLINFFKEDIDRLLFIVTFHIRFNDDMTIEITKADVFPVNWIPDIYVNPSNNGNLQSSHYKKFKDSIKRTNEDFLRLLIEANEIALQKKRMQSRLDGSTKIFTKIVYGVPSLFG